MTKTYRPIGKAKLKELIDRSAFRRLISEYLVPLLPGTQFDFDGRVQNAGQSYKQVTFYDGNTTVRIKLADDGKYYYQLRRSQPFLPNERQLIRHFGEEMCGLIGSWRKSYRAELADALMSRVVARALVPEEGVDFLVEVLRTLNAWGQQTYEGQRISCSVGISDRNIKKKIPFEDIAVRDFAKVITNGHDTLLECTFDGKVAGHVQLSTIYDSECFAPLRFIPLAQWTQERPARAVASLSRNGEILTFADGKLVFAKRRGKWRYFPHENIVTRMGNGKPSRWRTEIRRAVYVSALDVSFARTGGCIGLARKRESLVGQGKPVDRRDDIYKSKETKPRTLSMCVGQKVFSTLDRRLRQEIVAIDGATVLNSNGTFVAAGAILSLEGFSEGGGRRAAAKVLGQFGIGVKISNDGCVEVFADGSEDPILIVG